jgi:hypothetical protein
MHIGRARLGWTTWIVLDLGLVGGRAKAIEAINGWCQHYRCMPGTCAEAKAGQGRAETRAGGGAESRAGRTGVGKAEAERVWAARVETGWLG